MVVIPERKRQCWRGRADRQPAGAETRGEAEYLYTRVLDTMSQC